MDREALEGACGLTTITSSIVSRPSVRPPPPVHGDSNQQQPILVTKEKGGNDRPVERNNKKRNRQRRQGDAYQDAYRGFTFTPVPSTGRPGTPHRFFAESYDVHYQGEPPPGDGKGGDDDSHTIATTNVRNMRVHRHANGLCVVATNGLDDRATGGTTSTTTTESSVVVSQEPNPEATIMTPLQWHCQTVPDLSAAQKRKRVAAMLKQKSQQQQQQQGAVRPTDPLVTVTDPTATEKETATIATTTYPAVVFGSVLEVNTELTLDLLRHDPLLKGYLAVILPSGPFPPPPSTGLPKEEEEESNINTSDAAAPAAEAEVKSNA